MKSNPTMRSNVKPKVTILLTGGVSGGHAVPTLSTFFFLRRDFDLKKRFSEVNFFYFGREWGLERNVFEKLVNKYFTVPAVKLRSRFSILNFFDLLRLPGSIVEVLTYFWSLRKEYFHGNKVVLFSSGGYISLPVVLVAFVFRIPIVIHEQTSRAGLANRISAKFAKKVLITFQSSSIFFPKKKIIFTGYPFSKKVRLQLDNSDSKENLSNTELISKAFSISVPKGKKILLVMGGSMGSVFVNKLIQEALPSLQEEFFVFHQVGRDNIISCHKWKSDHYFPMGFVSGEAWIDLLRKADVVIARSGAGTVNECVYLRKKVIFIPLALARKEEQYHNALEAQKYINCLILQEKEVKKAPDRVQLLMKLIEQLLKNKEVSSKKEAAWNVFVKRTAKASESICLAIKKVLLEKKKRDGRRPERKTFRFSQSSGSRRRSGSFSENSGSSGNRKKRYSRETWGDNKKSTRFSQGRDRSTAKKGAKYSFNDDKSTAPKRKSFNK